MTIFIAISRGLIARNLLQNDFFNLIKKRFDKVVILSFAAHEQRFIKEFQDENIEIIPLITFKSDFWNNFISNLNKFLIYNSSIEVRSHCGYYPGQSELNPILRYGKYILLKAIFRPLSKIKSLRRAVQYFDYLFLQREIVNQYRKIIKKYKPEIIFAGSILEETEVALLKAAKKEKVYTVAMSKSWDNPSKRYFRVKADKLVVWSPYMKKQVEKLQDYKPGDIEIIGVLQFDYYLDKSRLLSREEFCKKLGLNPDKKIIFYGSEGRATPDDPEIIQIIVDIIKRRELVADCQILVRPHYAYTNDYLKFKNFFKHKDVIVDMGFNASTSFSDNWDYSQQQMNHFLNCLYHCEILLNPASTLTIDAIAINKPVILISFDGYKKKKFCHSVARFYKEDYLEEIVELRAAIKANNVQELKDGINTFLKDPRYLDKERAALRDYFCYKVDGQAGQRLFNFIDNFV